MIQSPLTWTTPPESLTNCLSPTSSCHNLVSRTLSPFRFYTPGISPLMIYTYVKLQAALTPRLSWESRGQWCDTVPWEVIDRRLTVSVEIALWQYSYQSLQEIAPCTHCRMLYNLLSLCPRPPHRTNAGHRDMTLVTAATWQRPWLAQTGDSRQELC